MGPNSTLMREFEKVKCMFGSINQDFFEIPGIDMVGEFPVLHYDSSQGAVILSK